MRPPAFLPCWESALRGGELTMTEFEMAEAASLDANPVAAAEMTEAGQGWFGTVLAAKAARRAVAAWVKAVNGDDTLLASMADPDAAYWLMNPVRKAWAIAAGPVVTEITIWTVKPAAEPPELGVAWRFTGRQRPVEPRPPEPGLARPSGWTEAEQVFAPKKPKVVKAKTDGSNKPKPTAVKVTAKKETTRKKAA